MALVLAAGIMIATVAGGVDTQRLRRGLTHRNVPRAAGQAVEAVCQAANVPTVRPRTSGATTSESAARRIGERNAFAAPITARAPRNVQISGASAHASAARPKTT